MLSPLSVYPHRASLKNMPDHGGNRTYDLWNTSPMLCQLSYAVWSVRVCDISELNLVPSISMLSNNNHDFFCVGVMYRHGFSGGVRGVGGAHPPEMICTPPEAFGTAPKSFCTPANYIYFDLIVSYLILLTTKFVKLPILWSQISPCRPRKQILLNVFLILSGRCHHAQAKASSSTPPDIYPPPPNENMKIRLW